MKKLCGRRTWPENSAADPLTKTLQQIPLAGYEAMPMVAKGQARKVDGRDMKTLAIFIAGRLQVAVRNPAFSTRRSSRFQGLQQNQTKHVSALRHCGRLFSAAMPRLEPAKADCARGRTTGSRAYNSFVNDITKM
jgi:hypothetical protein